MRRFDIEWRKSLSIARRVVSPPPPPALLLADPEIRRRYQFWFFSYPSGYPYPYSAEILRNQLDAHKARHQVRRPMVVIGHSMGGLISRLLVTDTDERLWQEMFGKPLAETRLSPATHAVVAESLIFRSRSDIGRVVFIASPHRGSDLAANWLGRMASRLVRSPLLLLEAGDEILRQVAQGPDSMPLQRIPNSVDTLSPNNRFVQAIDRRPIAPGIPYHTIVGDRGKGGNLGRERPYHSDGVVPYWSSHLRGPRSERVVPSNHSAHQHPEAIAEVARILKEHRP